MDPLTHTLTGLALSRVGLKRWSVHATPVLLVAANAPDLDIVTAAGGATNYLHYHRHITHALIAVPVMALLAVVVVRLFARKRFDWKWAYAVGFLGALSHPLLDWTNAYGIRLFLPFSGDWPRLDILNIVDVWIWAVLILAAVAPALSRLVSAEIGARSEAGRGWAIFALLFVLLFTTARYVLHQRAAAVLEARLYNGLPPRRVAALPGAFNPFRWTGLVDTGPFYSLNEVNLLGEFDPTAGRLLYKPEPEGKDAVALQAARRTETFRIFLDFSKYPLWRFSPSDEVENGTLVEAMDLRFGSPPAERFKASAVVDASGRVVDSWFGYNPSPRRR